MPFKLKLKKTRHYNVASKSLFVLSVELLDGGVADCTLSVDSTGQECLDNVCQRQAINQPEFFGLRYLNHNQQPRWVQLERPLKRQLDKYASSHQLYLRIMYYISSGMNLITDEVTRYHYFLQLKNDLVEGRIVCDCQQAVLLASYSRQAEYGNHDRERHTVEYLKNMLMFPKQMVENGQIIESSTLAETGRLEWLTAAVIQQHMALHNMSQAQAEEGFISSCQQLRGYGQEQFLARDQASNREVTIAISLTGITVFTETSEVPHFYRWVDITNVINHKRTFKIECQKSTESATFVLPSPEDGKYVWRLCVLQHTYYMKRRSDSANVDQPVFQEHGLSESREELDTRESAGSRLEPLSAAHRAHSTSCLELAERRPHRNRALLPSYRAAPDYETAVQQKQQQQLAEAQLRFPSQPLVYGSQPDIHRGHYPDVARHAIPTIPTIPTIPVTQPQPAEEYIALNYVTTNYPFAVNPNVQTDLTPQLHYVNVYKPPPPYPSNGLASNSTPDLAVASQALNYHRGYINSHVSGSSPDLVSTRTAINRQYLGYLNTGNHLVNYGRPNVMASTHGTYNNLPSVLDPNPHILLDPHQISDNNIQKVYDDRGNIMYSMPMHRIPYQRHFLPQQVKLNDTQEPIYENVPLPWQEYGKVTMRDRAQSLTTTDEIARLNERNSSQPTINSYTKPNLAPPTYRLPDNHYVNAQIINGVRESSVPKDNVSNRSNKPDEFENITLCVDKISLKNDDETPYQSLSTHKISNNNTINKSCDNITSIVIPSIDITDTNANMSQSSGIDSALSNSVINSTYSTSIELDSSNTTKSSVSSKEKKRRRWGMFIGRTKADVKSATLGRDRVKATTQTNKHRWSTGLPKFQPLPPSITKETLCQLLERKMSEEQLQFAFEQIPKGREGSDQYKTALLPQHAALNGYSVDSLPYEDNRVRLAPTPTNPHGYINASHVTMTVGSTQRFYIVVRVAPPPRSAAPPARSAAPPPRSATSPPGGAPACTCAPSCALVWECAWQHGATVLVMVGGASRPHYLPEDGTTKEYGKLSVSVGWSCSAAWGGSLRVRLRRGRRTRTLTHVHRAAPTTTTTTTTTTTDTDTQHAHMLEFLSEVNALRLASVDESESPLDVKNAPLILCSEGSTTPAGTALAADLLLHTLDTNQELDIPRTISLLHQQRANLIQNVSQYRFLHQVLLLYLKQSRLI